MALVRRYGTTKFMYLPHEVQQMIFNDYTEVMAHEKYKSIMDMLPSQLSNDMPASGMFVYEPEGILQNDSLYERLMDGIINILKNNANMHKNADLLQQQENIIGNYSEFMRYLLIDFLYIMAIKSLEANDTYVNITTVIRNIIARIRDTFVSYTERRRLRLGWVMTLVALNEPFDENTLKNILRVLDYRQLLQLKNICNNNALFYDMTFRCITEGSEYNEEYFKQNNCRRLIYDELDNVMYCWLNNHDGRPQAIKM